MATCFSLITKYIDISYNKYIFNNNNSNDYTTISFGLFNNSNNNYLIRNVPNNYPLTIFSQVRTDISNILKFHPIDNTPIIIYVSKGQDVSFNNNDYFRFYDSSYQLLNINHAFRTVYDSSLTDVRSNFYFMNNRTYKFIAITDFCSNFPFIIKNISNTIDYSLNYIDNSFTINIPNNADNSNNRLYYYNSTLRDICGNIYILQDISGFKYYYGDISFSYIYNIDTSNIKLSIKSYDFSYNSGVGNFGNKEISNNNFFYYSETCNYIIDNNLPNNYEFLNKVSAIDISLITSNNCLLSFNKNRHSNYINAHSSKIYDLSFGLGKGSYIIIDVPENFPMRLVYEEGPITSNLIAIDTTYQANRINKFDYTTVHNTETYYSGSFKINVFDNFTKITIAILDKANRYIHYQYDKFFYTELTHISGGSYGTIGKSYLRLITQQGTEYDFSDSSLMINNYDLKLDERFIDPTYVSKDKYGHNLNINNFINRIPKTEQAINQEISNNIISQRFDYNVLYTVTDYENTVIQNIRKIVVNSGPIIEISSNYFETNNIYKNNNQYSNTLQFKNNIFNQYNNFFDNIKVYIFDTSRQRINIPFEITISGAYYDNSINLINKLSNKILSYSSINSSAAEYLRYNYKYYYAYYNKNVRFRDQTIADTGTSDWFTILKYDVATLNIDNSLSFLLDDNNNGTNNGTDNSILKFGDMSMSLNIGSLNRPINNFAIQQLFDASYITLTFSMRYKGSSSSLTYDSDVSCSLKLNNYFFELSCNAQYPRDHLKISANFKKNLFFESSYIDNSYIDISYVGNYELGINTKGLSNGDYFYDFSKNKFFNSNITNKSRTYNIIIQDTTKPVLNFYDIINSRSDISYLYPYQRIRKFRILQDICFVNLKKIIDYPSFINSYVYNKPIIQYNDDSIYDFSYTRDISFTIVGLNTNISYNTSTYELSLNNINIDSSCIIIYKARDICYNWSQDISLTLNFMNIPYVELSGNIIQQRSYTRSAASYRDEGIKITTISSNFYFFQPPIIAARNVYDSSRIIINSTSYDISYNTDVCLNIIPTYDYSFNYIITISGSTTPYRLKRLIKYKDNSLPSFIFQDFSSITYTLTNATLSNYGSGYTTRRIHSVDNSFNIDFSFVVMTTFNDVSKVLYDFDVSDDYLTPSNMIKTIYFNTNTTPFSFNDISNYFDNNNRLNQVTQGNNISGAPLIFTYKIDGSFNNTRAVVRKVNIIDNTSPTIDFSFNNYYGPTGGYRYVIFDASYKDFSYVALDYNKTYNGDPSYNFIQELSSILFNFNLSDNYEARSNINYNITISNSTIKLNCRNATELSNNIVIKNLFSIKDTSFSIIYDISDNQYNYLRKTRYVKIIDISTNLDISFLNNSSLLTVSFGDTSFNILKDVSFNHKRLSVASISYDICYNLPTNITSISGTANSVFDVSALIYKLGRHQVTYYPKSYASNFYSQTRIIEISNNGPLITFPPGDISHEIYTPLSDASLIFGVTSVSIYDKFFFNNYKKQLQYNGTNFKVSFDNCLNILEPSFGIYNIYYSSTDLCGITTRRTRRVNVADRRPPIITICGDFEYELSGNNYLIPENSLYKEYGAYAYDVGTRIMTYTNVDISIISQKKITASSYEIITTNALENIPLKYNRNNINNITDSSYRIIYRVKDTFNNVQDICRNIIVTISRKPKLYPYIEISNNNGIQKYKLTGDISINTQLRNTTGIGHLQYFDLSLSFNYDNTTTNNQTIVCEAVSKMIFNKLMTTYYIKFGLDATDYLDISLTRPFINVEYETIESLNVTQNNNNKIYFYARDINQTPIDQLNYLEYNLKFIDTTPPIVTLLKNANFNSTANLYYPLLSMTSITELSNNINSYNNFYNIYNNIEKYYSKSFNTTNIVLFDPGIRIYDIVGGDVYFIDNSFQKIIGVSHEFSITDISINYYNNTTRIDVCNILFDGCSNNFERNYKQTYRVNDKRNNYNNDISRNIIVKRFPPFINLNYQTDCSSNKYITYYHKIYEKYNELKGQVIDYFEGALLFDKVSITNYINENSGGTYIIDYDVSNNINISNIDNNSKKRRVNVINSFPLLQQYNYNFNDIINFNLLNTLSYIQDNSYNKYSLYNGRYKFDVSENKAINIRTQEFDICNGLYDISNVVSIISDSSYSSNNRKFYFNNVTLTVSGDFNRLSIELSNNTIYPNIFVYDAQNTYINLNNAIYNIENNVYINTSYIVDISGLNNPNSNPYFVFNNMTNRDLYLSVGNYRFYQLGYRNFHNPVKFSLTKDGIHNGGIEYTKNVYKRNLPGVSVLSSNSNYIQINIDVTTPTIYYYCENFPNMGGEIKIKNNIIFSKQVITLNNYVIDLNTETKILNNSSYRSINNITEEILRNRVILTQRFDVSGGDTSIRNIICITQRNIQHNMLYNINQCPHKLIIRKYQQLSTRTDINVNSSIMEDNINNYLVENNTARTSYSFRNTYINLYKCDFDSSLNIAKRTADRSLDIYDEDIRPIFHSLKNYNFLNNSSNQVVQEIFNYIDFFRQNNILTETLLVDNFKCKIREFFFASSSKVLNLNSNNEYNYTDYILAPRIRISNITGNYIYFTLDIYYNTRNSWYLSSQELSTNKEFLFGTYDYIVYSDTFIQSINSVNMPSNRNFLTFNNGSITITSNLIYSYNLELSNNFYDPGIFNTIGHNDLNNTIFLSINDIDNSNSVCGLTKKNLYNNIYFDENDTLIFHKFNEETIINYQVNSNALRLQDTLKDSYNDDNYLIDICKNDIYNFYKLTPLNFYTLRDLSYNEEYNIYIAFTINDELNSDNNYLRQFEIDPIYLNNIPIIRTGYIYRQYSQYALYNYALSSINSTNSTNSTNNLNNITNITNINEFSYNSFSNKLCSHSYIIDLNDYFDINIYKDILYSESSLLTEFIDVKNLFYTLIDISYTNRFNLYDIDASQSVIFDPINLNTLLIMRNKLIPLYYKLSFMIYKLTIIYRINSNIKATLKLQNDDDLNYYIDYLEDYGNSIVENYTSKITIKELNDLYSEIFDNIQLLTATFNAIINIYNYRHDYLFDISNFLNMVIDFNYTNVNYLNNIILLLESNIQNILDSLNVFQYGTILDLLVIIDINNTSITNNGNLLYLSDISCLDFCFTNFYVLNNELQHIRSEVNVRTSNPYYDSYKDKLASNTTSNSLLNYKDLFNDNNLDASNLYYDLKYNFNLLNNNFIEDYYYVLYNYINVAYYNAMDTKPSFDIINDLSYNHANVSDYNTLYINVKNLYNIITEVYRRISIRFGFNKPTLYVNRRHVFIGSKLLINSYTSNSISMKLNIKYQVSLSYIIDLSTICLDVSIPDLTPPALLFNNNNEISFNRNVFTSDISVSYLIENKLVNNVSFIDLNQTYNISVANGIYYENSSNNVKILKRVTNVSFSLLEIDFTDASNIIFGSDPFKSINIRYIIYDNANNRNIFTKSVKIYNDSIDPIFIYKNRAYNSYNMVNNIADPLNFKQDTTYAFFFNTLNNAVRIYKPIIQDKYNDILNYYFITAPTDVSLIDISYIRIIDNSGNSDRTILLYTIDKQISNFIDIMNNELVPASKANQLYIEFNSSTISHPQPGIFKIRLTIEEIIINTIIDTHCCYPREVLVPRLDNYKLGSQNTTAMRMAKYLANRHI